MEDDNLRDIFKEFNPKLTEDYLFMNRLRHNLDSVELIKERNAQFKLRNRFAFIIASLAGLIMGLSFSLMFPIIKEWLETMSASYDGNSILGSLADHSLIVFWILNALISMTGAICVYDQADFIASFKYKESVGARDRRNEEDQE